MTNGEMIQKVFDCEVCEPIIEDDIIHVIFADKKDSAIGFDWSWWNAEYKESVIRDNVIKDELNRVKDELKPTIENDLGVDCISRQQAIDAFPDLLPNIGYNKKVITEILQKLPSITPIRPKGHWIEERGDYGEIIHWHCSNCYDDSGFMTTCKWDYCPNCGADMRGNTTRKGEPIEGNNESYNCENWIP